MEQREFAKHLRNRMTESESNLWRHLRAQGFTVMRFWNNEIMSNLDGVLATVMAAVIESPPLPRPSPARGEGRKAPT